MKLLVFAIALYMASTAGAADIYKCLAADGKVEFRDTPCQGVAGQKVDVKPSTAGGTGLADVRAQDAALNARMKARRDADDKANAAAYAANERAFYQERAHQDSMALQDAIRRSNTQADADWYNYNNLLRQSERERRITPAIVTPSPKPPRTVPAK